ncbi:MAG: twin-arginine translocase TatA/TatE family subunit [Candidatus Saccharibacteria bacterium]
MEIFGLGLPELLLIALVLMLLFGAAKLPELGRSLGGFGREIKKGMNGEDDSSKKDEKKSDK